MARKFDTTPARYDDSAVLGLLPSGRVIPVTNSERTVAACARRWWFSEDQGLRPRARSRPLRLGLAWHAVLEDAHRWWMEFDAELPAMWETMCAWCGGSKLTPPGDGAMFSTTPCPRCHGTGLGPVARTMESWAVLVNEGHIDGAEASEDIARLVGMINGWGEFYGGWRPYRAYRVVAVEVSIARPIVNPRTGAQFAPRVAVIEHDDGRRRYARAGEVARAQAARPKDHHVVWVRWPWYYIGRLDAVLAERKRANRLTVGEFKSSANPLKFARDLALDPQVPGYLFLLDHAVKHRLAPWAEDGVVDGWQYDLTSTSKQRAPKLLKKGGLSKAKANTPSWAFRQAVQQLGLDPTEYAEHIGGLAQRVDSKLYVRPFGDADLHDIDRVGEEVFGFAQRIAEMRRASATARDLVDIHVAMPRTALCRMPGGSCAFTPICHKDNADGRAAHFAERPGWWGDGEDVTAAVDDDTMPEEPDEQE